MHILEEMLHEGFQCMQHLQVYHQRFSQKSLVCKIGFIRHCFDANSQV